jgi:pimeloyl-ACP methyl ester carboxylesterase
MRSRPRDLLGAQARLAAACAVASRTPLLRLAGEHLTDAPRMRDEILAGVPATVAAASRPGPLPAYVFVNGVTARGRRHPAVHRLAYALARAGSLVAVPDPPGLARGAITTGTLDGLVGAVAALAGRDEVHGGRVALLGVSLGTTLALLAAQDERLRDRVSLVAGIAPYADLRNVIRLATTGRYPFPDGPAPYPVDPFLQLVTARTFVAWLAPGPDRDLLEAALAGVDEDDPDPLAPVRAISLAGLTPETRPVLGVLLNTDYERFDELYAQVPEPARRSALRLSPLQGAGRIAAPVELASAPRDKYFPLEESRAFVRAVPGGRLTVTGSLDHAIPKLGLAGIAELAQIDALAVRVLSAR